MAIVAVAITKIHNEHIDALYLIAFQESKHLKMFIAETRTFGFQNVFAHAVFESQNQRWSPRGRPWPRGRPQEHILKSLALASRPQVLENWPVLGSRTALFF